MNVSLTPRLEAWIRKKVDSGRYHSASEVVREGLRLLEDREQAKKAKLQALRRDIQGGVASGEPTKLDMEDVIERGQKRLMQKR